MKKIVINLISTGFLIFGGLTLYSPCVHSGTPTENLVEFIETFHSGVVSLETHTIIETMKQLVEKGADVNGANRFGVTPLMKAAMVAGTRGVSVIEFLASQGAHINISTYWNDSPLGEALIFQNHLAARKLIDLGAKVVVRHVWAGIVNHQSPLTTNVDTQDMVKLLIEKCDNLSERFEGGNSILHMVARVLDYEMLVVLLNNNLDVHMRDLNRGYSVLHRASESVSVMYRADSMKILGDYKAIVKELLRRGVSINNEDDHGFTPLHAVITGYAQSNGKFAAEIAPDIFEFLISLGADPLKKDHEGISPVHYASHLQLGFVTDALMAAIKKYHPEKYDRALADLYEDNTSARAKKKNHQWWQTLCWYGAEIGLDILALTGACHLYYLTRKMKTV